MSGKLLIHGLSINFEKRRATLGGKPLQLTPLEFRLIHLLASQPGVVFDREALISKGWGKTHLTPRSVDTLVKRLRSKVEPDPTQPGLVLTVWGEGYALADVT